MHAFPHVRRLTLHRVLWLAVLSLNILLSTLVAAQDASYTFTRLDVPGAEQTEPHGINDEGQIVGLFTDATGGHGFLKDGDTFITLDVPGATYTEAWGLNNAGQIVGAFSDGTRSHGFLTDGVTFTPIDVPGAEHTLAAGINDAGQIVGRFTAGGNHGFLTDGMTFTTLDVPFSGTQNTQARSINTAGQIVGHFAETTGTHGFLATPLPPDISPPVITIAASPATLSPPNGKLVTVTVSGAITEDEPDDSGVQAGSTVYKVIDEYGQLQPKGSFTPDADGEYTFTVKLQASKNGNDKDGRHYTIEVSATDHAGNTNTEPAIVTVPRK